MASVVFQSAEGSHVFSVLFPALPDLIWGTIAFAVVAVVVYKFAWPSFAATLDERREKIEYGLKAAQIAKAEIAAEREGLASEVAQAHAKNIVADAQTKAHAEADSIIGGAHLRIAADAEAAKRTLRADVGTMATELAGRIVGEAINDEALARRVIDRFISDLEAEQSKEASAIGQEK